MRRLELAGVALIAAGIGVSCADVEPIAPDGSVDVRAQAFLGASTPRSLLASRIAFTRTLDGNPEIYVMNADGSELTRLTDHPRRDWHPSWSPDGRQIAFVSNRTIFDDIWVMNADGSSDRNLTELNEIAHYLADPDWSPDGSKIAFGGYHDALGNVCISLMNSDGSGWFTRLVGPGTCTEGLAPDWSPDGTKLVFSSFYQADWDIWITNADGSSQTNLRSESETPPGFDLSDGRPAWSPDGQRIVFDNHFGLHVMNTDGSGLTLLTDDGRHPAWSPDGKQIAFTRNGHIFVMNADGSGVVQLTEDPGVDADPDWWGVTAAGCMRGGWERLRFQNQGECVRSIVTHNGRH